MFGVRANGRLDLGGYDYYLGTTWRSHLLELRFDATQGYFLGQPAGSDTTIMIPPQGLTKTDLMGNSDTCSLSLCINLPCRLLMRHGASLSIQAS
ncbi:MAG: hypothetical protein ACJ797_15250 [Ktedonobacteraceae bacterium]